MDRSLLRLIKDVVESASYGNSALKTLIDAIQTDVTKLIARFVPTNSGPTVYPTLAAAVVVTGDAVAQTLGAFVEIIPAATIASDFYVDGIFITGWSAAQTGELVLYYGDADTEFARVKITTNAGFIPFFAKGKIPANSKIRAKHASLAGGAQTVSVVLGLHY